MVRVFTSCRWSERRFWPGSPTRFYQSNSAVCLCHWSSSGYKDKPWYFITVCQVEFMCVPLYCHNWVCVQIFVGPTDLWRWKSTGPSGTLGQHPLTAFTAALTQWRRVFHGPVAFVKYITDTLRNLREHPIILHLHTGSVPGGRRENILVFSSTFLFLITTSFWFLFYWS